MKLTIGDGKKVELEIDKGQLHDVPLYEFSRRPIKALLDGHGQPVKVSDGGTKFYALPVGVYEAMVAQIQKSIEASDIAGDTSENEGSPFMVEDLTKLIR